MPIRPLISLASLCVFPALLRAEPPNLLQFRATAGYEHDSNVLATPTNEQSDDIGIFSVGVGAERFYSLQHFKADIEASRFQYRNHTNLDYSTLNYLAAWDWRFTPALHGVLSAQRRQFRDITDTTLAGISEVGRRTDRTELLEGVYDIDGVWRALAGVSNTSSITTLPLSWDASPTVRSAVVGGGYEWPSGSSLYGRFRHGDGEYKAPLVGTTTTATDFKENEATAVLKWIYSGKTTVDAQLGYQKRTHSSVPARDFSGPVGTAVVNWQVTGKTSVIAGLSRYLGTSGLDTGGSVVSDRIYIAPVWKATAHTAVNLRYDRTQRRWRDVTPGAAENGRQDTIESTSLGIDWEPRRVVTVSAAIRGERVKSNIVGANYRNTAVSGSVKLSF